MRFYVEKCIKSPDFTASLPDKMNAQKKKGTGAWLVMTAAPYEALQRKAKASGGFVLIVGTRWGRRRGRS